MVGAYPVHKFFFGFHLTPHALRFAVECEKRSLLLPRQLYWVHKVQRTLRFGYFRL